MSRKKKNKKNKSHSAVATPVAIPSVAVQVQATPSVAEDTNTQIPASVALPNNETAGASQGSTAKIEDIERRLENRMEQIVSAFDEKIEKKETKTTEILAIFITLFTFISVNITIFTKVSDIYTAVWFMLMMAICSIIILSLLFVLISAKKDVTKFWVLAICLFALISLVVVTRFHLVNWTPKLNPVQSELKS